MSRKSHHDLSELKYQAVGEYLKGKKTLDTVCKKYESNLILYHCSDGFNVVSWSCFDL